MLCLEGCGNRSEEGRKSDGCLVLPAHAPSRTAHSPSPSILFFSRSLPRWETLTVPRALTPS